MTPPSVSVVIDGEKFTHFTDHVITQSLDTFSTAGFTAPFEASRKEFRKRFRPFGFQSVNVLIDDKVRFTGTMLTPEPKIDAVAGKSLAVSCYGLPAVLGDCCPPASAFPLEFKGQTLLQIAQRLCASFGLTAIMDASVSDDESSHAFQAKKMKRGPRGGRGKRGSKFARVALEPGDDAHGFLVELAKQVGLVMTDNEIGNLVFTDSDAGVGRPVARFGQGIQPLVSIVPEFRAQEYYSQIAAFTPVTIRKKGTNYALANPFTVGKQIQRPHCFKLNDVTDGDAPTAVWQKIGRMLGNCAAWTIGGIPTWRTPKGDLWGRGQTVMVTAPDAYIFKETELLIRDVTLRQDAGGYNADLHVCFPGAFSGELPDSLPWDE